LTDSLLAAFIISGNIQGAIRLVVYSAAIIRKAQQTNFLFFNGKATRSIIGGLFYIVGVQCCMDVKQKTIAYVLNTTDTSIRRSYREWLETFPNMFSDTQ
jgi:transcription initiation factor TFIIIB Brf1 subunit/transcription initiation factor TFIIB